MEKKAHIKSNDRIIRNIFCIWFWFRTAQVKVFGKKQDYTPFKNGITLGLFFPIYLGLKIGSFVVF